MNREIPKHDHPQSALPLPPEIRAAIFRQIAEFIACGYPPIEAVAIYRRLYLSTCGEEECPWMYETLSDLKELAELPDAPATVITLLRRARAAANSKAGD